MPKKVPPHLARTQTISFKLSHLEKQELRAKAVAHGLTSADYCRHAILKRPLPPPPTPHTRPNTVDHDDLCSK